MGEQLVLVTCCDLRVPYPKIAQALGAATMPIPGAGLVESDAFARMYRRMCGQTPCIIAPHADCLAWETLGGDEVGYDQALKTAAALRMLGVPAAALALLDDEPPVLLDKRGPGWKSLTTVRSRINRMVKTGFAWPFSLGAVAGSVRIGQLFHSPFEPRVLRLAASAITGATAGVIKSVVDHFGGGSTLPVDFLDDVCGARCRQIINWIDWHEMPLVCDMV